MFLIVKGSTILETTSEPHYIKKDGELYDGSARFSGCNKAEAEGVAVKGKPYNLLGKELIKGLEEVCVVEADIGECIHDINKKQVAIADLLVDIKYKQILLALGVNEDA